MKKRFLLVLAVAGCLLALVLAIPAMADGVPSTSVMGHNLALEDAVDIIYYVDFQNVPGGAESGVLVWRNPQDSYTYGTEDAKLSTVGKDYGYDKFIFPGVSAKMMTQDIYAVSYIKNGGEITYSTLDKYSVLQYAYNMKGNQTVLPGGTATLDELLTDMLNYGTTAQKHFGYKTDRLANATYYQIKVEGGTLPDGATKGLYQAGESVTLTASAENFYRWKNSNGDMLEANNSFLVTVGEEAGTYTALHYSKGLEFVSNGDGTCYVAGLGTCKDTDIVIPVVSPNGETTTSIGHDAFYKCDFLTSVWIPNGITRIEKYAFSLCETLKDVHLPDTITEIAQGAFEGCKSLIRISIPRSITMLPSYVFTGCNSLQNVIFEENSQLTHIGTWAFYDCWALENINLPNGLVSIEERAFYCCTSLVSLKIPQNVTSIDETAFSWCNSLTSISVDKVNSMYRSEGNCIIKAEEHRLILGCQNSIIPDDDSVTSIGSHAFSGCTKLTHIEIPNSVMSIEESAFSYCESLISIALQGSITNIGDSTFYKCASLSSITYTGTKTQWNAISKGVEWNSRTGNYTVHCADGDIPKS